MMYTLSGKSGLVKLGFSVNGAACVVALTHHCRGPPSPKLGEGFQKIRLNSLFSLLGAGGREVG